MAAIEAISKTRLPADMKDRDRFVGVRVIRSGVKGQYFQARFSIRLIPLLPVHPYIVLSNDIGRRWV